MILDATLSPLITFHHLSMVIDDKNYTYEIVKITPH
jgi:hypothetical protein